MYSENIFIQSIQQNPSNRKNIGAFPHTIFRIKENQSWTNFLEELDEAMPFFEELTSKKSTLTVKKDEEQGVISIVAEVNFE